MWVAKTCPGCGRSGWCQQHESGAAICRRGPFDGSSERLDKFGVPYWVSVPEGARKLKLETPDRPELADERTLHVIYATILSLLPLVDQHRADWHKRGLSDEVIDRHGLRSWPPTAEARAALAWRLWREFGERCFGVPGFFVAKNRPMLAGGSGWALPAWSSAGRVVAIKIRSDYSNGDPGRRYYWLSSQKVGGPSCGSHARLAWPGRRPAPTDRAMVLRVTEGEVKAVVLAEHTGIPTLSVPGVSNWSQAFPWLKQLGVEKVLLCFDADFAQNPAVARDLSNARFGFQHAGYSVALEAWGEVYHAAS